MTIGSSPHRSLGPTLVWLEARLAELEAKGDYEASFALTSEMADWLMRSPEACLLYTSPSPRDQRGSRMPSSA